MAVGVPRADGGLNSRDRKESMLRVGGKLGWAVAAACSAEELTPSNNEDLVTVSRKNDTMKTVLRRAS